MADSDYYEYTVLSQADPNASETAITSRCKSTAELLSKFELVEEEIAEFLQSEKVDSDAFLLVCEWEGCEESGFPLASNSLYLHHMQTHIHDAVDGVLAAQLPQQEERKERVKRESVQASGKSRLYKGDKVADCAAAACGRSRCSAHSDKLPEEQYTQPEAKQTLKSEEEECGCCLEPLDRLKLAQQNKFETDTESESDHHASAASSLPDTRFLCKWKDCAKPNCNITQELEFARHVLYHPFHQKLKLRGLIALRANKIYVPCQLDKTYRNEVPEFPSVIVCRWERCSFKCNCITSFDDHVRMHIFEQSQEDAKDHKAPVIRGNNTRPSKGVMRYTCGWRGCALGFTCTDYWNMQQHLQSHTNLRQFACAHCGTLFCNKKHYLNHHRRQATEESGFILDNFIYQCTYCKKKYPSEGLLRTHMKRHVYNCICQYCSATFSSSAGLRKHILYRHRKERPFACANSQCDYRAKDRHDLQKHVERAHIARELFKCDVEKCTYQCYNEDTYQQHLKVKHSDNPKNYLCHVCNKRFAEGRTLSRHLVRLHDYTRPRGASRFRYSRDSEGVFRLQKVKYESRRLASYRELQKKAERSLLDMGVTPENNMDLVIRTDKGDQQLKFVSYRNALRELNSGEEELVSLDSQEEEDEEEGEEEGQRVELNFAEG